MNGIIRDCYRDGSYTVELCGGRHDGRLVSAGPLEMRDFQGRELHPQLCEGCRVTMHERINEAWLITNIHPRP